MADKKTIQVIIDGKIYVLSGENSESYLHDVADYLNHKIESIRKEMWNYNKLEESVRSLLLQINICDELFQERKKVEEMQELLDQEKSESYSYKHDLVKTKLKLDGVLQELESTQKKLLALEKKEGKEKISHEKTSHEKSSHQGNNKEESSFIGNWIFREAVSSEFGYS